MSVNVELLDRTLAQIESDPSHWEQRAYRCESGLCFAGWAAVLAGAKWAEPDVAWSSLVVAEEADPERWIRDHEGVGLVIHVHERAQRVLGIDDVDAEELFAGRNTLDDLRRIVAELKDGAA